MSEKRVGANILNRVAETRIIPIIYTGLYIKSLLSRRSLGKNDCKILIPSKGGTGIKLKIPRDTFIQTINKNKLERDSVSIPKSGSVLNIKTASVAIKKFIRIPAEATQLSANFPTRLFGLYGTGFAQPNE